MFTESQTLVSRQRLACWNGPVSASRIDLPMTAVEDPAKADASRRLSSAIDDNSRLSTSGTLFDLSRGMWLTTVVLVPFICGVLAVYLGKDFNWDLRNYHYYNAYAFLHDRAGLDIAPAQLQTYHNPLLDLPFYYMVNALPARVVGFILGFVQGLNLSLVMLIFWGTTRRIPSWPKLALGLPVLLVAAISPGFVLELGGTYNDNMASLFVLGALLFLIKAVESVDGKSSWRLAGVAGLIMGIGTGLKPTIFIYGPSTVAAIFALPRSWREKVALCSAYVSPLFSTTEIFISSWQPSV